MLSDLYLSTSEDVARLSICSPPRIGTQPSACRCVLFSLSFRQLAPCPTSRPASSSSWPWPSFYWHPPWPSSWPHPRPSFLGLLIGLLLGQPLRFLSECGL